VLSLGSTSSDLDLEVSAPSPSTFIALRTADVLDVAETQRLQQQARDSVPVQKFVSVQIQRQAESDINSVFADAASLVVLERDTETVVIPSLPEPDEGEEPTEETAMLTGRVFLDIDGDGVFSPDMSGDRVDTPLAGVRVTVITAEEELTRQTDTQGTWTIEVPAGHAVVVYDFANGQVPNGWFHDSGEAAVLVECEGGQTCSVEDVGFVASLRPIAEVEARLTELHPNLPAGTISYLAVTASDDVVRGALREPLHLPTVQQVTLTTIRAEFGFRVEPDTLTETQLRVRSNPPPVYHVDTQLDVPGGLSVGEIVSAHLAANYLEDETATQLARETAAAAVEDQLVAVREGSTIVREGDNLTRFHIDAINQTALRAGTGGTPSLGLLAVIAMMVMVMGLYLSRFRQEIWSRPRMVALLGILLLVVAASVRLTVALAESTSWYILPAVAFGFITAILFDQRIALLMALAVGVVTAVGTYDLGLTVYAVLAAMAPIPFVSAVSSRGAFRNAVVLSSLTAAGVAAATSWFFHVGPNDQFLEVVGFAVAWAFGASVVASLVGLASLQFFESAFDITTTLSLLDLTDRNHDALQLLQEKAFGTFNHSLMVGTLADAASRAIGANPLLARAMAYYHDLGKTVNPTYFIENQFGMQNPHDLLEPKASAEILRAMSRRVSPWRVSSRSPQMSPRASLAITAMG
jgi:putative nucleotidyltransferase with HDIG domain